MEKLSQQQAPIYEALEELRKMRVVPFDVPGHKRGRGNPELTRLLGERCMNMDVNSMKPLDNLCHPVSVIAQAEQLAAEAFHAAHAFLMVGGTTSSVQSMILSVAKRGEKIILPRNVHRSVIGAMVLCGAVPVYVNPQCNERLGIPLGMRVEDVKKAMEEHPDARMLFMTRRNLCLLRRQQGESAVNLLCAIPPAFPFWRRESALQKRLWSIYSMPWKKDVPLPGRRIRRLPD